MKHIIFILLLLAFCCSCSYSQTTTFQGAWFTINYPSGFTSRASLNSATSGGVESAFFASPDGEVEFYIFSPQWKGEPLDIAVKSNEKITNTTTEKTGTKTIKRWTINDNAGTYCRSYQKTIENEGSVIWVIGIKYKSQASYNRYKPQYLQFKSSLRQFSD